MIVVEETNLPGVLKVRTRVFHDDRGAFRETWHAEKYQAAGIDTDFSQDNVSISSRGVIRGLHYQWPNPQAKLVSVLDGEIWDVAVDVRRGSETFGRWCGARLTADGGEQLYVPEGFAHGFAVTSETAIVAYRCSDLYLPTSEHTILWNDPDLAITWPFADPVLSEKDRDATGLAETDPAHLPDLPGRAPVR